MRETCQQYVDRRLSEGWQIVGRFNHTVFLSPPDGAFIRPVDLQNDTETLRPNAAGDECNILFQTGAACPNHYLNVDEEVADDIVTDVTTQTANGVWTRDLYNIEDHSVGSGTINKITVYARFHSHPSSSQDNAKIAIKSGTTVDESTAWGIKGIWVTESYEWASNPDDSQAWEWADIDALQIGISMRQGVSAADPTWYVTDCTQVYVEIDYTEVAPPQTISDVGAIASAEAFGTLKANLNLAPSAIASLEAIGASQLNFLLALAGVASGEAFGTPKVSLGFTLFPDGITSLEAFGASIVAGPLILAGIPSGEALGSPTMVISISAIGIASEEAVGEPKLNLTLFPTGIATAEALGIPQLNLVVFPSGAESGEAFGVLIIAGPLILTGIESEEAFGSAAVSLGLTLLPSGIPSEEAVGTPVVKFVWVAPSGLRYIVELHDSSGNLEAILENAYNISFTEALNEAPLLEFSIPADEEKISGVSRLGEIWLRDYETGEVVKKFLLHLERDIRT